ncbi:MAG: hypothetical protein A4E66_02540 [Syntrophus sp. PtaB.Bin001]|nr:MAG: hypothetical protein A4E66_02540 [Syntrophus sp. PtaB.Bin001]
MGRPESQFHAGIHHNGRSGLRSEIRSRHRRGDGQSPKQRRSFQVQAFHLPEIGSVFQLARHSLDKGIPVGKLEFRIVASLQADGRPDPVGNVGGTD